MIHRRSASAAPALRLSFGGSVPKRAAWARMLTTEADDRKRNISQRNTTMRTLSSAECGWHLQADQESKRKRGMPRPKRPAIPRPNLPAGYLFFLRFPPVLAFPLAFSAGFF